MSLSLTEEQIVELEFSYTAECRRCGNGFFKSSPISDTCLYCQAEELAEARGVDFDTAMRLLGHG